MDEIKAIPRNQYIGMLADALKSTKSATGAVGDFLIGDAPRTLDQWSYGFSPVRMGRTDQGLAGALYGMKVDPGLMDVAGVAGMAPSVGRLGAWAGKEGLSMINDAMMGGGNQSLARALSGIRPRNMISESDARMGMVIPAKKIYSNKYQTPTFGIDDSGQAFFGMPEVFSMDPNFLPTRGFRSVDDFLWGSGEDTYLRMHSNPNDFKYLSSGTHRGSINHATKESEGGLSVTRSFDVPYDNASIVKGRMIGRGSDGEPLLDINSVAIEKPNIPFSEAFSMVRDAEKKKALGLGISEDELRAIKTGMFRYFR